MKDKTIPVGITLKARRCRRQQGDPPSPLLLPLAENENPKKVIDIPVIVIRGDIEAQGEFKVWVWQQRLIIIIASYPDGQLMLQKSYTVDEKMAPWFKAAEALDTIWLAINPPLDEPDQLIPCPLQPGSPPLIREPKDSREIGQRRKRALS